jgi:membrane protease YdiL (CAAX protease family)
MKKYLLILLMPVELALLYFASFLMSDVINNEIVQKYIVVSLLSNDPRNLFLTRISIGLISSVLSILGLIAFSRFRKIPLRECGFKTYRFKDTLRIVIIFLMSFMTVYVVIGSLTAQAGYYDWHLPYPMTLANNSMMLFYEFFISGLEELYYRAFVMLVLLYSWRRTIKSKTMLQNAVLAASTLIFTSRHIGIVFSPFRIIHILPVQLFIVTAMGFFFGYLFLKTKSIMGPYLAHGLTNGCIYLFLIALNLFM